MLAAPWTSRPALLERPWRPFAPLERPLFGPRRRQRVVLGAAAAAVSGVSGRTSGTPKALEPAVQVLMTNLKVSEAQALRMSKDIRKFAVARDGDDATGSRSVAWAKKLCRGLEMHAGLEPLLRHVGGVEKVLLELEKRSRKHTQVFQDIAQQHEALREGDDIDMEEYSKTAEYMGHEWWVRASHQRIIDRIDQYYLLSADQLHRGHPPWVFCKNNRLPKGWREYTLQGRRMFWNPETMRMQNQVPESLTLAQAPEPVELAKRIFVLCAVLTALGGFTFIVQQTMLAGGYPMTVSFCIYGVSVVLCAVLAYWKAIEKDLESHRRWGLRAFAMGIASFEYRVFLYAGIKFGFTVSTEQNCEPLADGSVPFFRDQYYNQFIAWFFFVGNWVFVEWYLRASNSKLQQAILWIFIVLATIMMILYTYWGIERLTASSD